MPINESLGEATLQLSTEQKGLDKGLRSARKKVDAFQRKLASTGRKLSLAVTAPIVAGFGKATQLASDLEESLNAVNVVFGESADRIHDFAKQSVRAAGLTQRAWNQAAAQVGSQLSSTGMEMDAVADKTNRVIERSADLASVFNTDVNQALSAIQAGLRGEIDPLERFGVVMNAASVEAQALEMGLIDANEEMTAGQKVAARYAVIMEQTSNIAGDFRRTSGNLANQTRILRSRIKQLGADLGRQLLPIVKDIVQWLNGLVTAFSELSEKQKRAIMIFSAIAAAIGPAMLAISGLIKAIRGIGRAFTWLGKGIAKIFSAGGWYIALVAAIVYITTLIARNFEKIKTFVKSLWKAFRDGFMVIAQTVRGVVLRVVSRLVSGWQKIGDATKALITAIGDIFGKVGDVIWNALRVGVKQVEKFIRTVWGKMAKFGQELGEKLWTTLNPKNWIGGKDIGQVWAEGFSGGISEGQQKVLKSVNKQIEEMRQELQDSVETEITPIGEQITDGLTPDAKAIDQKANEAFQAQQKWISKWKDSSQDLKDATVDLAAGLWDTIKSDVVGLFEGAKGGIEAFGDSINTLIQSLKDLRENINKTGGAAAKNFPVPTPYQRAGGGGRALGAGGGYRPLTPGERARTYQPPTGPRLWGDIHKKLPEYEPSGAQIGPGGEYSARTAFGDIHAKKQPYQPSQGIFQTLKNALQPVTNIFDKLRGALQPVLNLASRFLSNFKVWNKFMQSVTDTVISALKPAVDALVNALKPLIPAIGQMFEIIGNALVPVFQALGEMLVSLKPLFKPLGKILATMVSMLRPLLPILKPIINLLVDVLKPVLIVLGKVLRAVTNMIIGIAQVLLKVLNFLIRLITPYVPSGAIFQFEIPEMIEPGSLPGEGGGNGGGTDTSTPGTGGGTTTIRKRRPINVTINIRDNEIAGEDGFEQLARIIRTQFERMEAVNI